METLFATCIIHCRNVMGVELFVCAISLATSSEGKKINSCPGQVPEHTRLMIIEKENSRDLPFTFVN